MAHMSCFVAYGGERDIYTSTHEQDDSVTRMRTDHLCYDVVDIYIYIRYDITYMHMGNRACDRK